MPPDRQLAVGRLLLRVAICHDARRHGPDAVIRSFSDAETRSVWEGQRSRRLPGDIQVPALRKLRPLKQAGRFDDLRVPPGNRLEALRGDRAGQHSIRVNCQWQICFRWENGHAEDVAIVDYHDG